MYRNINNITSQTCNVIVDDQSIATYSGTQVNIYKLVTNDYYLFETRDYSGLPTNLHCYSTEDISKLPSKYDFIDPIYHYLSIIAVLIVFYLAYRLIIYPFFRSHL